MRKKAIIEWKRVAAVICATALLGGGTGIVNAQQKTSGGNSMEAEKPPEVSYPANDFENWDQLLAENTISDSFKAALSQFAFESGSRVLSAEDGNVNYSPLSLYYALALAGSGAEGETAAQITASLGVTDQDQLAEQSHKLYQWLYYYGERQKRSYERNGSGGYNSTVQLGNSLWISDQLTIKEDYRRLAASQFFASSYQVDFTKPEASEQIGQWISEHTNGVLQPMLEMEPQTMLAILNTLYFYGGWENTFNPTNTADDSFTKTDGSQVTVPFMNRVNMMDIFHKGDGYTVSALSTNNSCSMIFLLPDQGRTVDEFLDTPEKLEDALGVSQDMWQRGEITWKVPKFSFGSNMRLVELLKTMGMEKMFIPNEADFGGISDSPLCISQVIQETHIGIDEDGVEGAAYTIIMGAGSAMIAEDLKAEMILDRPFIYGIQDDSTGAWLFLGVCRDPADIS